MLLYTFQQLQDSYLSGKFTKLTFEELIQNYKPIELPSDEEIEIEAEKIFAYRGSIMGFGRGAKWIKEQILNQNK